MCGASVEVDVVVVGDEPPETDSTPSAGSRLGARLGVAAALAVVVGLAALVVFGGGSGDDGDEGAVPEATVTPAEPSPRPAPSPTAASDTEEKALAPIVQVGDPLEWRGGVELGPGRPLLVAEWQGRLTVLASPGIEPDVGGLVGWVSEDGETWESLGVLIAGGNIVSSVSIAGDVLLAVGDDAEGQLTVWRSSDAASWLPARIGTETSDGQGHRAIVGGNDRVHVVAVAGDNDPIRLLRQVWPDAASLPAGVGWSWGGQPLTISVQGPFGIPLLSATAAELGLADDAFDLSQRPGPESTTIWTSIDGGAWQERGSIDNAVLTRIVEGPDGSLLAGGWWGGRALTLVLTVGSDWEPIPDEEFPWAAVARWGENLVAAGSDQRDLRRLEGTAWRSLGIDQFVDETDWYIPTVVADDTGLAVLTRSFPTLAFEDPRPSPAIIVKNGYTLAIDPNRATLSITDPDGVTVLSTGLYGPSPDPNVVPDLASQTIGFNNERTGQPVVAFAITELTQLEQASFGHLNGPDTEDTILYTTDANTWSRQTIDELTDGGQQITDIALTDTLIVLAAHRSNLPDTPLSIWIADRP